MRVSILIAILYGGVGCNGELELSNQDEFKPSSVSGPPIDALHKEDGKQVAEKLAQAEVDEEPPAPETGPTPSEPIEEEPESPSDASAPKSPTPKDPQKLC